jgi:hypothetical protein
MDLVRNGSAKSGLPTVVTGSRKISEVRGTGRGEIREDELEVICPRTRGGLAVTQGG